MTYLSRACTFKYANSIIINYRSKRKQHAYTNDIRKVWYMFLYICNTRGGNSTWHYSSKKALGDKSVYLNSYHVSFVNFLYVECDITYIPSGNYI